MPDFDSFKVGVFYLDFLLRSFFTSPSSFASWQRVIALLLSVVLMANTGLFSAVVYAQKFEVKLDDFRDTTPKDQHQYGLVNVMVEDALMQDGTIASDVQNYCKRIQTVLGSVCLITRWNGETPSRIVETLQQLYFEGQEVPDGLAKLIGLVIVGDVPLPVVRNGDESFPSIFPYTDLVDPAYVYDPDQHHFIRTKVESPQAEIWHGLIRPPGKDQERLDLLHSFFEKNAKFYAGESNASVFKDAIGFHDHFWENDAFDNESKRWYLEKMKSLERLMNYRYSGEWLQQLSGEAVDRLAKLTSRVFPDASVKVDKPDESSINTEMGFDPAKAKSDSASKASDLKTKDDALGGKAPDAIKTTVPDAFSPGAIRNFLKDYINVVTRYISGTSELLDKAGRRQSYETLASLITTMDKYHATVLYLVTQEFERYFYDQAKSLALDFEMVDRFDRKNDYYSQELTSAVNSLKPNDSVGPPPFEEKPKTDILGYGSEIFHRYVNGVPVENVKTVDDCSIERGSNFISSKGELGRAISLNRKDDPLTAQDIAGVSGQKAKEEIKKVYQNNGYCSYIVKDQCMPGASKVPLLDYASSEIADVDNDYRRCFNHDGPTIPEESEHARFHSISSIVNHDQPTGDIVRAMLEKKIAHYFPIDAVRHVSYFLGGAGKYGPENVGRLNYPNFFDLKATDDKAATQEIQDYVLTQEKKLRQARVEANWQRFAQYLDYSSSVSGRPDYWNYDEIDGFSSRFKGYRASVMSLIRPELDPDNKLEDFEVTEKYLIGDSVKPETEQKIQDLLKGVFPQSLAHEDLNLKCDYTYEVPPINVDVKIPKLNLEDVQALMNPVAAFDILTRLEVPKFSPPSITRTCSNKIAKSTKDEVKSLRSFYFALGGVSVDVGILHKADGFIEVMDPKAVILYFTPAPYPLPPNTNQLLAIKVFDMQLDDLKSGPQPADVMTKTVKPVPLLEPGELQPYQDKYLQLLTDAVHWKNLSIEGKHKEGLSLLSKNKEMLYVAMDGDAQHLDFNFSNLEGTYKKDADPSIASRSDLLDEIKKRENALAEKQKQDAERRALQNRTDGQKPSKCGDSVPLLQWPGAVSCWLQEMVAGPLIVPPKGNETVGPNGSAMTDGANSTFGSDQNPVTVGADEVNASADTSLKGPPGEIAISDKVLFVKDQAVATVNLPLTIDVKWSGSGAVRVVPQRDGQVSVIPEKVGSGVVMATYDDGFGSRSVTKNINVVDRRGFVRQKTSGEVQIGTDDSLDFVVEVRDVNDQKVKFDGALQILPQEDGVFNVTPDVTMTGGDGRFTVHAGTKAKMSGLSVGSDEVAPSPMVMVNTLAGPPAKVTWNFGDKVVGLDHEISGEMDVQDQYGNPYRAEGVRVDLSWDPTVTVNGNNDGQGTFFLVAGQLPITIKVSDQLYKDLETQGFDPQTGQFLDASGKPLSGDFDHPLPALPLPQVQISSVDGYPDIALPEPIHLDINPSYRVSFADLPKEVTAGQNVTVSVQVLKDKDPVQLDHKEIVVQREIGGDTQSYTIALHGGMGKVDVPTGASAGKMRLVIDDPDFGSQEQEVVILGKAATTLNLDDASYADGHVKITVTGRDAYGNPASLKGGLATINLIGEGGEVVHKESLAIDGDRLQSDIEIQNQPDRLHLELSVDKFPDPLTKELQLAQTLDYDQLKTLSWDTPYLMMLGSGFADYRFDKTVAQAMLFGDASKVQAMTSEITPHNTYPKLIQIWPTGRVTLGPDMKVNILWQDLKPVLVFSDPDTEIGRLMINPRDLKFSVQNVPSGDFTWTKAIGEGKAILVPDPDLQFVSNHVGGGDLSSAQGSQLISFDQSQVVLHDPEIKTAVFDDSGESLVLEWSLRGKTLARWYLDMNVQEIVQDKAGPLQWQLTATKADDYTSEFFYAGESTLGERGLAIFKKGDKIRNDIGRGSRVALDDVRENNGEGFGGEDKVGLSFLAGSTVGESTILQSEGMINLGDPVISLRQVKRPTESGDLVPVIDATTAAASEDYSIGQLVYAPDKGQITHILRADVDGNGTDDLALVITAGKRSVIRYLQGNGEGARWGDVADLLDLGEGVKDVQVLQKKSFLVLYDSGQMVIEQNQQGKYSSMMVDLSPFGGEDPKVVKMAVKDFDGDGYDDVALLSGDRQLAIWYGTQSLEGVQFGVQEKDRQSLKVIPVSLKNPDNLKTGAWLLTKTTPTFEVGCREERFTCQGKYFRAYDGPATEPQPAQEPDRLQQLQDQSQSKPFIEGDANTPEIPQQYLVRLDQLQNYVNDIDIKLLSQKEGAQLNLGQKLQFEATVVARRTEDPFVLRYDLGQDFTLVGNVECEGCTDTLQLNRTPDSLWSLEGTTVPGQTVTLKYTLQYKSLPDFSFEVMNTNDDPYPDLGINVDANTTSHITVFESRGPRQYVETVFGQDPPASPTSADNSVKNLTDVMRGIGVEGKSKDEIKQMLLDQQKVMETKSTDLFDSVQQDNNGDGYPDVYQENQSLVPKFPLPVEKKSPTPTSSGPLGFLENLGRFMVPQANAQDNQVIAKTSFSPGDSQSFSGLDNTALMVDNIGQDVQLLVKALKCSRGCLPLPINFAFLAPGTINIFGEPAGFDPGLPVFAWGVPSLIPVWPPSPYQASAGGRIYMSPTLTAGLGIGICLGPYLLGQCMVFTIPIQQIAGSEKICDAAKQGLGFIMQGINTVVGTINAGTNQLRGAINSTGVMKAKVKTSTPADIEAIVGVSLGGGTHNEGINPTEPKVFLPGIPKVFVDWWDRQWEEIVNSLTDLPNIYIRVPNLKSFLPTPDYLDKMQKKVSGTDYLKLQQIYDLINSLPVINLQAKVLTIQIPWIEPGILRKIEQSLYKFLFDFILEFTAFLKSFNLPCDISVVRDDLFKDLKDRIQKGKTPEAVKDLQALRAQVTGADIDLKQAETDLQQFSEAQGFAQPTVELRRKYIAEMTDKRSQIVVLNKKYDDLTDQVNRLQQPEKITDLFQVFGEVVQTTVAFWQKQVTDFNSVSLKDGLDRESAHALRSCVALKVGVDLSANVTGFVDGIKKNIDALQAWKKFPRELAKYLNILEFYIGEVIKFIDQLTNIVLKWWSEFQKKLDLWINVILSYQEFIALIKLIIDILKGYNKKCGLCTSDRLTLKMLILKILFGVVPKFPIIAFPKWPDVRLDFSDVKLALDVSVPVFDVKTLDLKWPKLPQIKFPRFEDIKLSAAGELSGSFSVKLPDIPLVIPAPPILPPLQPLPNLPQINLPNLPPAPEVPKILESLLPLMKIIQTILDIWCLVNKALIPIEEKTLKTEIENLTNRSLNLILPIDLLLEFDAFPGNLLSKLVPFDLINVTSHFQAGVKIDPLPDAQNTIDEQFHKPMNQFLQQIDVWIQQLRNSAQQGLGDAQGSLQQTINKFGVDADVNAKASVKTGIDLNQQFPLLNYTPVQRPSITDDMIAEREKQVVNYHSDLKQGLADVQSSLARLTGQDPEDMLRSLAKLPTDNVLVAGTPTLLNHELASEKRDALYDPKNFVEKEISLVDKPGLFLALNESKNALQQTQDQLLGSGTTTAADLGVAVVRDGQANRIQDYPLNDPVVAVWDNDVLLGYEKGLYVKSVDGTPRRPDAYTGGVLQSSVDAFQRSKVHLLAADSVSSDQTDSDKATIHWTWDSPGVTDVELTVWDTVAKAQRLDLNHTRFYLQQSSPEQNAYFAPVNDNVLLHEGQETLATQETRLRFGDDQVIVEPGVNFSIPSLILRSINFSGSGAVHLENYSGHAWSIQVGENVTLDMNGLTDLSVVGPQLLQIPTLAQRPWVKKIVSKTEGALKSRIDVVSGEKIPVGQFYTLSTSTLKDDLSGAEMNLPVGVVFTVTDHDHWTLVSGKGQDVVADDQSYQTGQEGMVLMDDELLTGNFIVQNGDRLNDVSQDEQVVWSTITGQSFDVTLPRGNYYGRIREQEGNRGYSPIVHAAADKPRIATAQVVTGTEEIPLPLYAPLTIDAKDSVVGDVAPESFHWQLEGDDHVIGGQVYNHLGFDTIGDRKVQLYIRSGENDYLAKTFVVKVFLPKLTLDTQAFTDSRTIRIQSDPPLTGIPVGIVGERDGVQDWLLSTPIVGSRLGERYYTDESGALQLPALSAIEGLNIVIEAGLKVARLYPSGRVVLNDEYQKSCQNEPLLDSDGYLKFRVSCIDNGSLVKKFEVRMIPDLDTDVSIVDHFSDIDRGVSIRSLQAAIELIPLSQQSTFAPGGVQVRVKNGDALMVIRPNAQVELVQKDLTVQVKPFTDPTEPLVWQLVQNNSILVEFTVKGPGDKTTIIDAEKQALLPVDKESKAVLDSVVPKKVTFTDVPDSSPYAEAIKSLSQLGFIQGFSDSTFKPDQAVTRAEALKIIMSVIRCENCASPSDATKTEFDPTVQSEADFLVFHGGSFTTTDIKKLFSFTEDDLKSRLPTIDHYLDVQVSDWYYYCVEIATKLGLVHGYGGAEDGKNALGKFIPDRQVNVAELAKIVVEALGGKNKPSNEIFGPAIGWWNDPNHNYLATARDDLQLFQSLDAYKDPLRPATRAEVAYAAWRVLSINGKAQECTVPTVSPPPVARLAQPLNSGIEIAQFLNCNCLVLVDADLYKGSSFFAVMTGTKEQSDKVVVKSNTVTASP